MIEELFCTIHGPYDAIYRECPYCSGAYKHPRPPKSLNEDETRWTTGARQPPSLYLGKAKLAVLGGYPYIAT